MGGSQGKISRGSTKCSRNDNSSHNSLHFSEKPRVNHDKSNHHYDNFSLNTINETSNSDGNYCNGYPSTLKILENNSNNSNNKMINQNSKMLYYSKNRNYHKNNLDYNNSVQCNGHVDEIPANKSKNILIRLFSKFSGSKNFKSKGNNEKALNISNSTKNKKNSDFNTKFSNSYHTAKSANNDHSNLKQGSITDDANFMSFCTETPCDINVNNKNNNHIIENILTNRGNDLHSIQGNNGDAIKNFIDNPTYTRTAGLHNYHNKNHEKAKGENFPSTTYECESSHNSNLRSNKKLHNGEFLNDDNFSNSCGHIRTDIRSPLSSANANLTSSSSHNYGIMHYEKGSVSPDEVKHAKLDYYDNDNYSCKFNSQNPDLYNNNLEYYDFYDDNDGCYTNGTYSHRINGQYCGSIKGNSIIGNSSIIPAYEHKDRTVDPINNTMHGDIRVPIQDYFGDQNFYDFNYNKDLNDTIYCSGSHNSSQRKERGDNVDQNQVRSLFSQSSTRMDDCGNNTILSSTYNIMDNKKFLQTDESNTDSIFDPYEEKSGDENESKQYIGDNFDYYNSKTTTIDDLKTLSDIKHADMGNSFKKIDKFESINDCSNLNPVDQMNLPYELREIQAKNIDGGDEDIDQLCDADIPYQDLPNFFEEPKRTIRFLIDEIILGCVASNTKVQKSSEDVLSDDPTGYIESCHDKAFDLDECDDKITFHKIFDIKKYEDPLSYFK